MIEVEGLSKGYEGKEILRDVAFRVEKGEIFAIMGPSGAGKTTLLRIMDLLDVADKGKVLFDGKEATNKAMLEQRRRMAMVFQGAPLFNASVFDNVAYGLKLRKMAVEEISEKVRTALKLVDLEGYEERNAKTLSGGESQRVAFAMAAVIQPDILFMDEPTANLDPINEAVVEEIMKRINRLGITVVLATHKQAEAMRLASRVAVINRGAIEQIGTPEEIFQKPKTLFVARFVGTRNIFRGRVVETDGSSRIVIDLAGFTVELPYIAATIGDEVHLCIRPEDIMLIKEDRPITAKHTNVLQGKIIDVHPLGTAMFRLDINVDGRAEFIMDVPRHVKEKHGLEVGRDIRISLKASSCHIIRT